MCVSCSGWNDELSMLTFCANGTAFGLDSYREVRQKDSTENKNRKMSWLQNAIGNVVRSVWSPQLTTVRFRYHADKVAKGPLLRRYGYRDPIQREGLLPHRTSARALPMPAYR